MTWIRNPGDGSIGQVSEEIFQSHWRHLGWTEVPDDEVKVLAVVARVTDSAVPSLDALSRDELVEAADRAGVKVRSNAKKETIIEQLREAAASGAVDGAVEGAESA